MPRQLCLLRWFSFTGIEYEDSLTQLCSFQSLSICGCFTILPGFSRDCFRDFCFEDVVNLGPEGRLIRPSELARGLLHFGGLYCNSKLKSVEDHFCPWFVLGTANFLYW